MEHSGTARLSSRLSLTPSSCRSQPRPRRSRHSLPWCRWRSASRKSGIEPVVLPLAAAVEALPPAMLDYRGGLLPKKVRDLSRERRRAADISQEALARRIGISRPQLANAEAGRFGLSPEAAARFLVAMASLPVRQPSLLLGAP